MTDIKQEVRSYHEKDVKSILDEKIEDLKREGFEVEFGKIGTHTTYALLHKDNHETEIVGYTFVRDMKFHRDNVGKIKALQQAIARKNISEGKGNK